jgi:hypothetical protein
LITKFTISQPKKIKSANPKNSTYSTNTQNIQEFVEGVFFFSPFILNQESSGKNMKEKKRKGEEAPTDTPRLRFSQAFGLCILAAQLVIVLLYLLWT